MKIKFYLLLMCLSTLGWTQDQGRVITGTITSAEDGTGLPGVNVVIKGLTTGTITDLDGNYSLSLADSLSDVILIYSFVGFETQEVNIKGQTQIDLALSEETVALQDVVVVGYGTMDRATLASSVSTIGSDQMEKDPLPSITQAIQGRAAGVQVTQNSGSPGSGMSIRIRGTNSITGSSEPLYVVDGIPVNSSTNYTGGGDFNSGGNETGVNVLATINPSDIQSVEVLKDAAATSIYGSRASNGVVLITTKRGKAGSGTVSLNAYAGVANVPKERWFDLMNTEQYVDYMQDVYANAPAGTEIPESILRTDVDVDWQDEIFQTGVLQSYQLSASGGSDKTRYFTSIDYFDQEGTVLNTGFQRISARLNLDHDQSEKLSFSSSLNVAKTDQQRGQENNSEEAPFKDGVVAPPNNPVFDENGNYYFDPVSTSRGNTVGWLEMPKRDLETYRILGNVSATYKIMPWLSFKSNWAADISSIREDYFIPPNNIRIFEGVGQGKSRATTNALWLNEQTLSFDQTFGGHHLNVLAGFSYQQSEVAFTEARASNFLNNDIYTLSGGSLATRATSSVQQWAIVSYFGRINYDYKKKYLLNLNYRVDGSSRFGANNRFGYFPSAALGWRISEEDFFKDNINFISELKLRGSWGLTGNQNIDNYLNQVFYSSANYLNDPAFIPGTFGDENLSWETTEQFDAGIDLGLFQGRIKILADYYVKNTSDLLMPIQVSGVTGFTTAIRNVGEIQNKGLELELNTKNLTGDFKWNTYINANLNKNKVVSLPEGDVFSGIGNFNVASEGLPLGSFFGWEMAGVNPETGMIDFVKLDGTLGAATDPGDKKIIGNPNPKYVGGITNEFFYKGFDLSVMGQFVYDVDIYNYTSFYRLSGTSLSSNGDVAWTRRWRQPGDETDMPRPTPGEYGNSAVSTRWVEDGSFFRIRNITLGYALPGQFLEKIKISNLRIYATVQNAFVFTKYSGYDPEVNTPDAAGIAYGTDHGNYPQPRIFTGGLTLTF